MKRTSLYEIHRNLGAKITEFSGWEMPLYYSGVTDEHEVVREGAGIFDIGHMGRIEILGKDSLPLLQTLTVRDVARIPSGSSEYTLICNQSGGIIDDILISKRGKNRFFLCVNAGNREKIVSMITKRGEGFNFKLNDLTGNTGMIALQGPRATTILDMVVPRGIGSLKPWRIEEIEIGGKSMIASMTGYTGEIGYEIIMDYYDCKVVWEELADAGRGYGIKPCGLGARDTLRLEMGYLLHGNDIDENTTPFEAGLGWLVDLNKEDFIGKTAILDQKKKAPLRRLIFFELLQKGVPRKGFRIFSDGKEIGVVTSGNISPMLRKGIGIGYVQAEYAKPGVEVLIDIRGKVVPANIVNRPFYKKSRSLKV